jgi:hypothetical protein
MKYIVMILLAITIAFGQTVKIKGNVYINGIKANKNTKIHLGDLIKVGKKSKISFNIGKDAFMSKNGSTFSIKKGNKKRVLNLVKGRVLAVFKKGSKYTLKTSNMTAGIRGTGIYANIHGDKTYFCTCYGETEFTSKKEHKSLKAVHHNMVWVNHKDGSTSMNMTMDGHSDNELRELEKMVSRKPAFDKINKKYWKKGSKTTKL